MHTRAPTTILSLLLSLHAANHYFFPIIDKHRQTLESNPANHWQRIPMATPPQALPPIHTLVYIIPLLRAFCADVAPPYGHSSMEPLWHTTAYNIIYNNFLKAGIQQYCSCMLLTYFVDMECACMGIHNCKQSNVAKTVNN